ncbi:MAG: uroporphyrinogen decarboxylase family protein [Planctomycetota bacterium]
MNDRERFRRLFRGEPVDRPPLMEEGVRDEVLEAWHRQGLPEGKTHADLFGLTPHENLGPDLQFVPSFFGRVLDLTPREYRSAFDVSRRRFPDDWDQIVANLRDREHIVCIWATRGFFQALGVGDWPTLERALLATIRAPERIRERLELYGDFCARMLEMTMRDVDPEFIYLSEPISDSDRPLISPDMFEEFMAPVYERVIAAARSLGCDNILLSTYGNTTLLLPTLIKAGINMLWLSEAAEIPDLDYRSLRARFGKELGLIGGIPLSILRSGSPEGIRARLEELVPALLAEGRYVPLAGGRVRDEIPWSVYKCYREVLAELIG